MMGNDDNDMIGKAMMLVGDAVDEQDITGLETVLSDDTVFRNMVEMANNAPIPRGVSVYDYIIGVAYVSYLMNGYDMLHAYAFAIGVNLLELDEAGVDELEQKAKGIDGRKFVTELKKIAIAPIYIRYQYLVDDAIDTAVELMKKAKSEKVRLDSATLLLDKLTIPEASRLKIEQNIVSTMKIDGSDRSAIDKLSDVLDGISKGIKDKGHVKPLEISKFDLLPNKGDASDGQ